MIGEEKAALPIRWRQRAPPAALALRSGKQRRKKITAVAQGTGESLKLHRRRELRSGAISRNTRPLSGLGLSGQKPPNLAHVVSRTGRRVTRRVGMHRFRAGPASEAGGPPSATAAPTPEARAPAVDGAIVTSPRGGETREG
ncbi:hypothetical protein MTO96_010015 [Rhipicephalus appendiculatus]